MIVDFLFNIQKIFTTIFSNDKLIRNFMLNELLS